MSQPNNYKKWVLFVLRWGIAVFGIAYVVSNINLHDHVLVYDPAARKPVLVSVVGRPAENTWPLKVELPSGTQADLSREDVLIRPDQPKVTRMSDGAKLFVLALRNLDRSAAKPTPAELLVSETKAGPGTWIKPSELVGGYVVDVEFPVREIGLIRMFNEADTRYLLAAVFVIPIVYFITGYRWWLLLSLLDVPMGLWRTLQINMVGAFYNTFMPGSTGGDVLKAYYAAKNAHTKRTLAVLSVIVDRAIGLLALVIMGGVCAAFQWQIEQCRQVAIVAAVICIGLGAAIVILGYSPLRRALGFDWLIARLPMQEKIVKTIDGLRGFRSRPGVVLATLLMSFPVHATVVVSAMFAGLAFGLPLAKMYYWVVVPTVVLAGALPISPQGAGVMEFFAILLTRPQGATVGQAFALTLSIRLVQIIWNLAAGILVLVGGYHAPTETEQAELESEEPEPQVADKP